MSRNLDALIAAQVLGWKWLYHPGTHHRSLRRDAEHWNLEEYEPGVDVLTDADDLTDVPKYSVHRAACHEAEQAVMLVLGLEAEYLAALEAEYKRFAANWISWDRYLLEVDPATRCKAMLTALDKAAAKYQGVQMQYVITRQDGRALSQADVDAIQDRLHDVMTAWLDQRGLGMTGGSTPYTDDKTLEVEA